MPAAAGEIVLDHVSRTFTVRSDRARTIKELLIGRSHRDGPTPVRALDDVSLKVGPGETVGIVGRNGAGKSSLLRVLAGIIPADSGEVRCGGRVVSLLELGAGFGRDFSGRENVYLNGALHGLSRAEIEARLDAIIAFSELGEFADVPVKAYSSGMLVRLGFSIAAHLDADVMLIDEVLAVGDEAFQRKCLRRISERIAAGATVALVSHEPSSIERVCERVIVLDAGRLVFDGPTAEGLLFYHRLLGTEQRVGATVRSQGDRALPVVGVELLDDEGRSRQIFRTGEPLRVALRIAARAPVARPRVVLEVRDAGGRRLFRTETAPVPFDGQESLIFEVERLPLLGGDYDLAVAAVDAVALGDPVAEQDRVVGFSVAHEAGGEGTVDLRGTWRSGDRERVAP